MSKFITAVPVDVAETLKLLPPKSFIHSIELVPKLQNPGQPAGINDEFKIEIIWDNDDLKTSYTFPLPYPIEKLRGEIPVDKKVKKGNK